MKIKFLKNMELEVITGMIDEDTPEKENETFRAGQVTEIEEVDDDVQIQFGDGSVCFVTEDFWNDVEILEND